MKLMYKIAIISIFSIFAFGAIPEGFVYLSQYDPSIMQEIRYAGYHNFVGRPITGYNASECILTIEAARNISNAQRDFLELGYSIKVFDCYRPQKAVDDFYVWSLNATDDIMKDEFYPRLQKSDLFKEYISSKSNHTKGSTSDLALVKLPAVAPETYYPGMNLTSCFANITERFHDDILDFGTGFDCLDTMANTDNPYITPLQMEHRMLLKNILNKHGFINYPEEWWHFSLYPQPYPNTFFNFDVDAPLNITISSE